jgi:hypothetical protein
VIRPHSPSLSLSAEASSAAISLNQEQLVILLTKMSSLEIGRKLARAQIDGATGCNSALTIGPCCCITSTATLCSDISCPYLTLELARFSSWSCASTSLMTICRANPVVIFPGFWRAWRMGTLPAATRCVCWYWGGPRHILQPRRRTNRASPRLRCQVPCDGRAGHAPDERLCTKPWARREESHPCRCWVVLCAQRR